MARLRASASSASPVVVPAELLDPAHVVWVDADRFVAYMVQRGWPLPARERLGNPSSPRRRRLAAAECWAVSVGITRTSAPKFCDHRRLRALLGRGRPAGAGGVG